MTLLLALLLPLSVSAQSQYATGDEHITPKKRETDFYGRRSYPFGRIPQYARTDALDRAAERNRPSIETARLLSSSGWRQHGPTSVGGRVRSIALHPRDGRTLWIGAAAGGVWKSIDGGANWVPVMDHENSIAMGALAVSRSHPDILFAGTGEMSPNVDAYLGAGIFRSTDGGTTWNLAGLSTVGAFSRIVIHPDDPEIVLAGATKNGAGFYRSTDGGRSWRRSAEPKAVSDITIDPTNPERVWIGTLSQGILYSEDGGRTFSSRNTGIDLEPERIGRVSVQCAPSNPSILYSLFAELDDDYEVATRIYKSADGGASWTSVLRGVGSGNFLGGQGWYNNVVEIMPGNPDLVLAGGVKLMRTTDGGRSWNRINGTHDDHHAIAFDPVDPRVVYDANDGGMYRSDTAGIGFRPVNNGLAITQFFAIGIDQRQPDLTFGGTQDNGTLHNRSGFYGDLMGGDGGYTVVDHSDTTFIYGEYQEGSLWRFDRVLGKPRSIMDGIDRSDATPPWMAPIVIDPADNKVLYTGRKHVYRTTNQGELWEPVSDSIGNVSALAVSPADNRIVWAGTEKGRILVSTNSGREWIDRSLTPGVVNRWVTDFAPSFGAPGTAYVSFSGFLTTHLRKTTDFGATWSDVGDDLPDIPVNALALDPDDERILYAGTDIGMFISLDGGISWATFNEGLPRVVVVDLEIHRGRGVLRAATHGRSIWEIDLVERNLLPEILSPAGGEIWPGRTSQSIRWTGFSSPVTVEYSLDDGASWHRIVSGATGGAMRWKTPDTTGEFARLRIIGGAGAEQVVSNRFTIEKLRVGSIVAATAKPVISYALGYDGRYLWAADFHSSRFLKLDTGTLATVEVVEARLDDGDEFITDMAWVPERGTFYLNRLATATGGGGWIYEMTPSGEQVGRWNSPATYPIGLAWLGGDSSSMPYLMLSDRDGNEQTIYLLDTADPAIPVVALARRDVLRAGPRGAAAGGNDGRKFWQIMTDFGEGSSLVEATARMIDVELQDVLCSVPLTTRETGSGLINARGVELDPRDGNLWVSDFVGNIWKVVTCEGLVRANDTTGDTTTTVVRERELVAAGIRLEQNVPNPFAGGTIVRLTLERPASIALHVQDMRGHLVATIYEGTLAAGEHRFRFEAEGLASGVYRCTVVSGGRAVVSRTLVVLR